MLWFFSPVVVTIRADFWKFRTKPLMIAVITSKEFSFHLKPPSKNIIGEADNTDLLKWLMKKTASPMIIILFIKNKIFYNL